MKLDSLTLSTTFEWHTISAVCTDYAPYAWLIVSLLLLLAEVTTPGLFFFVAFACGACGAAASAALGYSFFAQCISLLTVFALSFVALRRYTRASHLSPVEYHSAHTNVQALIGAHATVVEPLAPHGSGRVRVRSEVWSATNSSDTPLATGAAAVVVGSQGNRLIVRPQ